MGIYTSNHSGLEIDTGVDKGLIQTPKSTITVATIAERNAIATSDLVDGKIVFVEADKTYYEYNIGTETWAILEAVFGQTIFEEVTNAPFTVNSDVKVDNLNVDEVDGRSLDQDVIIGSSPSFAQVVLTQTTGTAPMVVASTTKVNNLNVDKVDDYHFNQELLTTSNVVFNRIESATPNGQPLLVVSQEMVNNLNSQFLGGKQASDFLLTTNTTDNIAEGITNLYYPIVDKNKLAFINQGLATSDNVIFNRITSATPNGAPFIVNSIDIVPNLNVSFLNGKQSSDFLLTTSTTDNIAEGTTNKYFNGKTTDNLPQGTSNKYYNETSFNSSLAGKTTDNITEGGINKYFSNALADARITAQKGNANGLATLDATSRIPIEQIPSSITGALTFVDTFDASTGSYPADPVDNTYYICDVAGTISGTAYSIGDWAIYKTIGGWSRVPVGNQVSSVNNKIGAVVLTTTDIAEGTNKYYEDSKARLAIQSTIDGLPYNNTSGVLSLNPLNYIPLVTEQSAWNITASRVNQNLLTTSSPSFQTITSATPTGTAPFNITSTTVNPNLNADLLDGLHSSSFLQTGTTTDSITQGITNLYYADSLARASISSTIPAIVYTTASGVLSLNALNYIPLVTDQTNWNNTAGYLDQNVKTTSNVQFNQLYITGGIRQPIVTKTGNYTINGNDYTVLCDTTSNDITITLPSAVGISGRIYNIKRISSGNYVLTVNTTSAQTIDGYTSQIISKQYTNMTIQSNGTNWYVL